VYEVGTVGMMQNFIVLLIFQDIRDKIPLNRGGCMVNPFGGKSEIFKNNFVDDVTIH
jgi:hypothetical protein